MINTANKARAYALLVSRKLSSIACFLAAPGLKAALAFCEEPVFRKALARSIRPGLKLKRKDGREEGRYPTPISLSLKLRDLPHCFGALMWLFDIGELGISDSKFEVNNKPSAVPFLFPFPNFPLRVANQNNSRQVAACGKEGGKRRLGVPKKR